MLLTSLLILFALLVSLVRGLLPKIDDARLYVIDYLERSYAIEVDVASLDAQWQAFGPALQIKGLILPKQAGVPLNMRIETVEIKLNFWQSLQTWQPQVERVTFSQVAVDLALADLAANTAEADLETTDPLTNPWLKQLLFEQLAYFRIEQLQLKITDPYAHTLELAVQELAWSNHQGRHKAIGELALTEQVLGEQTLNFQVDLQSSTSDLSDLAGGVYLQANQLQLNDWLRPYLQFPVSQLRSELNFQAWFTVAQNRFTEGVMTIEPSHLQWATAAQKNPQHFLLSEGQVLLLPEQDGWRLHGSNWQGQSNGQTWQPLHWQALLKPHELQASLAQFQLQHLLPFSVFVPEMSASTLALLEQAQLQLPLHDLQLHAAKQQVAMTAALTQMTWQQAQWLPSLDGLDLALSFSKDKLNISLPAQEFALQFPNLSAPIPVSLGASQFAFVPNLESGLQQLRIEQFSLLASGAKLKLSGLVQDFSDPLLQLAADFSVHDALQLAPLFYLSGMGDDVALYLEQAIQGGIVEAGQLLWRGRLSDFPYADNSGLFQAAFQWQQGQFAYLPDWPAVTQIKLDALFENLSMDLQVQEGEISGIDIQGAQINIPELGEHTVVQVAGQVSASVAQAEQFIAQTDLQSSVGETLAVVQVEDQFELSLDLEIPLADVDSASYQGQIQLTDAQVSVDSAAIELTQVSGELHFHNAAIETHGLTGALYGQAIDLALEGDLLADNERYQVDLAFEGNWQVEQLPEIWHNPLTEFYQGEFDWQGQLKLLLDPSGYSLQAQLTSDLIGVELELPPPFAKAKQYAMPVRVDLIGDQQQLGLSVKLANLAELWGQIDTDFERSGSNQAFKSYDLMLGRLFRSGDQLSKDQGQVYLDLAHVDLAQWQGVLTGFVNAKATESSLFPAFQGVTGEIKQLHLLGQRFDQLALTGKQQGQAWRLTANSPQLAGYIDFYPSWEEQGFKLVADRLALQMPAGSSSKGANFLPPMAIDIYDFSIAGRSLGHLVFQGSPVETGYQVQTLSFDTGNTQLNAYGQWIDYQTDNVSALSIDFQTANFNQFAERLQLTPGVHNAPLSMQGNFMWPGTFQAFDVKNLDGEVYFEFGKGHLSEVSDQGARIFSLFSLDSILRKLSLDFSDVFGEGLYFNSFQGDLVIEHGVISTDNTVMDAVAGTMKVTGQTDLRSQGLDYDIRFVPHLASSVPTVVLVSTSAWTLGLGAFALTKVLEPVIEVISEIRFQLGGTLSAPILNEFEHQHKEITLPDSLLPTQPAENPVEPPSEQVTDPQSERPLLERELHEANALLTPKEATQEAPKEATKEEGNQ